MTRHRRELLDVEAQVADASRHDRDQHAAAAVHDRRDLRKIGGRFIDADRVPDQRDLNDHDDQ